MGVGCWCFEQGGHSALSIPRMWTAWRLRGDDDISWGLDGYLPSSLTHSLTHPVSPTTTTTTTTMIPSYLPPRGSSLPPHPHFDVAWFSCYINRRLLPHGESPAPVEIYINPFRSLFFLYLKLCVEQSIPPSTSAHSSYHSAFQRK